MSVTSVINLSNCSIAEDILSMYCNEGLKYLMKSRFMIGEGANIEKAKKIEKLSNLLKHNDCLITFEKEEILRQIKKLTY